MVIRKQIVVFLVTLKHCCSCVLGLPNYRFKTNQPSTKTIINQANCHNCYNALLYAGFLTLKIMKNFKQFRRSQIAEMREVTENDINVFKNHGFIHISEYPFGFNISISDADKNNGSPKIGDMIARNPKDYSDQWLVAEQYFKDNFEKLVE